MSDIPSQSSPEPTLFEQIEDRLGFIPGHAEGTALAENGLLSGWVHEGVANVVDCPTEDCDNEFLDIWRRPTGGQMFGNPSRQWAIVCSSCEWAHERFDFSRPDQGRFSRWSLRQRSPASGTAVQGDAQTERDSNSSTIRFLEVELLLSPISEPRTFVATHAQRDAGSWTFVLPSGEARRWNHEQVMEVKIQGLLASATDETESRTEDPLPVAQGAPEAPIETLSDLGAEDGVHLPDIDAGELEAEATELLSQLTGSREFHPDQFEAIEFLVGKRARVLLVQRTGWGKSAVYFIATKMLRDRGLGPTMVVSPLLSLMRNQLSHAARTGIRAETINSSNSRDWDPIIDRIRRDEVDLLLISPERLANRRFEEEVLSVIRPGLLVVDEVHCVSDWGHDFRPDYRRIKKWMGRLPGTNPIVACTATANDRVVEDIGSQLGDEFVTIRGELARDGLSLSVQQLGSRSQRLAWLVDKIQNLAGTGIIYCLTRRDCEDVAAWLIEQGITAQPYLGGGQSNAEIEQDLLSHNLKVVVATKALGMGFDMPDLSFVIHFQSPGSVVEYYQQVGRAGRQLEASHAILLPGEEDSEIHDFFRNGAFADQANVDQVLALLDRANQPIRLIDFQREINLSQGRLLNLLKNLEVDDYAFSSGFFGPWERTPKTYQPYPGHQAAITEQRLNEWEEMQSYSALTSGCRMEFLQRGLDGPNPKPCGICDLCRRHDPDTNSRGGQDDRPTPSFDHQIALEAVDFLKGRFIVIKPRLQGVPTTERAKPGLALCGWGDGGWGDKVRRGKQDDHRFSDELVEALALKFQDWEVGFRLEPTWVTCVPSLRSPELVTDFARKVANRLAIPFQASIEKVKHTAPQKRMENSQQQRSNVSGAFRVIDQSLPPGPVLLIDDVVDSRWTLTEVCSVLCRAGSTEVIPLALADSKKG